MSVVRSIDEHHVSRCCEICACLAVDGSCMMAWATMQLGQGIWKLEIVPMRFELGAVLCPFWLEVWFTRSYVEEVW